MSPHGSKLWELCRYLANQLLTDSQRKKIKNLLFRLQRVPLKALGIEALIDAQKAEIERLKSRLTVLDGKFNIALYGLPKIQEDYRFTAMNNSLLVNSHSNQELDRYWDGVIQSRNSKEVLKEFQSSFSSSLISGEAPRKCLILGLDLPELAKDVLEKFPKLEGFYLCDTDSAVLERTQQVVSENSFPGKTEVLSTDLITALIALSSEQVDMILSQNRYQRLPPSEQVYFLHLVYERLKPGGVFYLSVPRLSSSEVAQDLYWMDPRNLRPYSSTLIQNMLKSFNGKCEMRQESPFYQTFIFKKSNEVSQTSGKITGEKGHQESTKGPWR